jgi:hypothetical protein
MKENAEDYLKSTGNSKPPRRYPLDHANKEKLQELLLYQSSKTSRGNTFH